jgi:tetratricopeptide (TPR) repeat protein
MLLAEHVIRQPGAGLAESGRSAQMAGEARPSAKLPLGEFLQGLSQRWRALSREELLAVLLAHAERLPVRDRQAFLNIFPDPGEQHAGPLDDAPSAGASLLTEIKAFTARVAAGEYADDEEYYRDRYGWSDEEAAAWAPEADTLFAATGDLFVAGNLATARQAYERLLALFGPLGDDGGQLEFWQLDDTDGAEALARYLRSVYETSPTGERADAVHRAYLNLPWSPTTPTLAEVAGTRREPLPDLEVFLPGWIEHLLGQTDRPGLPERVRLLTEAATLHGGVDGLSDLTARPGPHQVAIGLAWIDALAATGRLDDAAAAARQTLELPDGETRLLAQAADRLADLNASLGDAAGAVLARRKAWAIEPDRRRLLALTGSSLDAGTMTETLAAEADTLTSAGKAVTDRLGCELLLLTGRLEPAIAALTTAEPLGWHRASHPGPVVLPFLLAATIGRAPGADDGHLGQMFTAIDRDPDALPRFEDWHIVAPDPALAADQPEPVGPCLTGLLADLLPHPGDDADRAPWIATAAAVVDARIHAIVSGKHRRAYARAASLAFAHAETLAAIGRPADAHTYLAEVRARFPRHVAFRAELDAAARTSTLTIRPTPRR